MEILQQTTAETTNYMIMGYAVIFSVMLAYVISLMIRANKLKQALTILEEEH